MISNDYTLESVAVSPVRVPLPVVGGGGYAIGDERRRGMSRRGDRAADQTTDATGLSLSAEEIAEGLSALSREQAATAQERAYRTAGERAVRTGVIGMSQSGISQAGLTQAGLTQAGFGSLAGLDDVARQISGAGHGENVQAVRRSEALQARDAVRPDSAVPASLVPASFADVAARAGTQSRIGRAIERYTAAGTPIADPSVTHAADPTVSHAAVPTVTHAADPTVIHAADPTAALRDPMIERASRAYMRAAGERGLALWGSGISYAV